jgi:hypothetical protein
VLLAMLAHSQHGDGNFLAQNSPSGVRYQVLGKIQNYEF